MPALKDRDANKCPLPLIVELTVNEPETPPFPDRVKLVKVGESDVNNPAETPSLTVTPSTVMSYSPWVLSTKAMAPDTIRSGIFVNCG